MLIFSVFVKSFCVLASSVLLSFEVFSFPEDSHRFPFVLEPSRLFSGFVFAFDFVFPLFFLRDSVLQARRGGPPW